MADARLGILIQADGVGQTTQSISILEKQLERLQRIASLPNLSFRQQERLNALLNRTQSQLTSLRRSLDSTSPSLNRLNQSANQSTQAMINLGRVVQDAPYGFIGIANNLNPLLESFQRLRATTGTTGGALRALASSLGGAGGLGLALSVVSSAFLIFGGRSKEAKEKAKDFADEVKRAKDVLKDVSGSLQDRTLIAGAGAAEEIAKVNVLASAVTDQTRSYKERNNALEQLKKINKGYFGDLTLEANSLSTLTSKVEEYTNAIIASEVVKAFSSDIGKIAVESAKSLKVYNDLGKEVDKLNDLLSKTPRLTRQAIPTGDSFKEVTVANQEYIRLTKKLDEANKKLSEQGKIVSQLSGAAFESRKGLEQAINESLKFKPLVEIPASVNKVDNEALLKQAKEIQHFYDIRPFSLRFSEFDTKAIQLDKARKTIELHSQGKFRLLVHAPELVFTEPLDFSKAARLLPRFDKIEDAIQAGVITVPVEPEFELPANTGIVKLQDQLNKIMGTRRAPVLNFVGDISAQFEVAQKALEAFNSKMTITKSIADAVSGSFSAFIDAVLSGQNAFASFGQFVTGIIKQIIAELIKAVVVSKILSIITGGGKTVVGGLLHEIGTRAEGGPVRAGQPYIVGERGPELIIPGRSGTVIPNHNLGNVQGFAQTMAITVNGIIRGQDILLSNNRTGRSNRRTR